MGCCYFCSNDTTAKGKEIVKSIMYCKNKNDAQWKFALCQKFHRYYVFNQFEYFQKK
jgi:hypothetical protein